MSANPESFNSKAPAPNTAMIEGMVVESEEYQGKVYTRMRIEADEPYGDPQRVTVRSDRSFARAGEETQVMVKISGYERRFRRKDETYGYNNTIILDKVT